MNTEEGQLLFVDDELGTNIDVVPESSAVRTMPVLVQALPVQGKFEVQ
jgi:hypothetical protein